jgi:hypothetical protein
LKLFEIKKPSCDGLIMFSDGGGEGMNVRKSKKKKLLNRHLLPAHG